MKILRIENSIFLIIAIIALLFFYSMFSDAHEYREAKNDVRFENYEEAYTTFEELGGYKDSEVLKEYCGIMKEYDSTEFTSIYHCCQQLREIKDEFKNRELSESFREKLDEIEKLYENYSLLLCRSEHNFSLINTVS